jgi:hypothetical protein
VPNSSRSFAGSLPCCRRCNVEYRWATTERSSPRYAAMLEAQAHSLATMRASHSIRQNQPPQQIRPTIQPRPVFFWSLRPWSAFPERWSVEAVGRPGAAAWSEHQVRRGRRWRSSLDKGPARQVGPAVRGAEDQLSGTIRPGLPQVQDEFSILTLLQAFLCQRRTQKVSASRRGTTLSSQTFANGSARVRHARCFFRCEGSSPFSHLWAVPRHMPVAADACS